MAHDDDPALYGDGFDPYDEDEGYDDAPYEDEDDGGWGQDPPARRAGLRLLVGIAALLLGVGLIAALQKVSDDDDPDTDEVATDDDSTSSSRRSTTSGPLGLPGTPRTSVVPGSSTSSSPTVGGGSSTTRRATSTSVPDEAAEPRCASGGGGAATPAQPGWETRWQTMPRPNDPAKVTICVDDVTPKVGQVVRISLVGDDPDAVIPDRECSWFVTWEGAHENPCQNVTVPTGPAQPTPAEAPGHVVVQRSHVYDTPGTKTIIGSVASTEGALGPYTSYAESDLPITVRP